LPRDILDCLHERISDDQFTTDLERSKRGPNLCPIPAHRTIRQFDRLWKDAAVNPFRAPSSRSNPIRALRKRKTYKREGDQQSSSWHAALRAAGIYRGIRAADMAFLR